MQPKAGRLALKAAVTYLIAAGAWILFSDKLLAALVSNPEARMAFSMFKGLGFVVLTTALLHHLLRRVLRRWEREAAQRQEAEISLRRSERALRTINSCNQVLVRAATEPALLERLCRVIVEEGGYRMAWVGFAEHDEKKSVRVAAHAGHNAGYLDQFQVNWADTELGRGPTGLAIRTGRIAACHDFKTDPKGAPWREAAVQRGYASSIALPLRRGEITFGALTIYSSAIKDFNPAEVGLLTELADDLAYGLQALRSLAERQLAESNLLESEARYRQLFELESDAIILGDPETHQVVEVNQSAQRLYGYSREEFLQLKLGDVVAAPEKSLDSVVGNDVFLPQCWHRKKSGERFPVEIAASVLLHQGRRMKLGAIRDITERQQAEAALIHSERVLREGQRLAKLGNWEWNTVTDHHSWSPEIYRIYGRDPKLGPAHIAEVSTFFTPESWARLNAAVEQGLKQGTNYECDAEVVRPDGTHCWITARGEVMQAADGKVTGLRGTVQDITERKQAEAAVRDSEQKYRRIFESSLDAIVTVTPTTGRFTSGNPAAVKMFEARNEADFLSRTPFSLSPEWQPDGRDSTEKAWKMMAWALREGSHFFEWTHRRINGEEFFADVLLTRMEREGEPLIMATVRDITERKQREGELRLKTAFLEALVHSSMDGIMVVDNQNRKIFQNQRVSELWKIPPAIADNSSDQVQMQHAMEQTKDPAGFMAKIQRIFARPSEFVHDEVDLKDGTVLDRQTYLVKGDQDASYGRVWIFRDVTQSRTLEARLRQAQKMEAIGTLAGGIAHDFNNILAAIFGYGHLLQQDTEGNKEAQEDLAEILRAANRAKDLVQQILTFSRQREQKREVIRLAIVVKEATKFLRASLPADIHIAIKLDADAPAVLADPTQIYQVTMNLATNALHALEGRSGQITISLETFQPDEIFIQAHPEFRPVPYARLTVADTGHGMDAQTLERIFDPFFTTKPAGKGTGLGLAVVHGIIQSHDGIITVESEVGHGTAFKLCFPAQTNHATTTDAVKETAAAGRGQHILLLDDEPALTAAFQRLLERLKYHVTVSNHAPEAIELFRENPAWFDLVITDLTMPEMNGLEVAHQIHALRPELPVILVSGFTPEFNREKLHDVGIFDLLEKPVSLAALADILKRALAKA